MSLITSSLLKDIDRKTGSEKVQALVHAIKTDIFPWPHYTALGKYLIEIGKYNEAEKCLDTAREIANIQYGKESKTPKDLQDAYDELQKHSPEMEVTR
jgi:ribosomal protein S7